MATSSSAQKEGIPAQKEETSVQEKKTAAPTETTPSQPDIFVQTQPVAFYAATGHASNVEIDSSLDEADSTYSGDSSSETTSVSSSVFSYTYSNGRRYHSDRFRSSYFLPNDDKEQDRLDFHHHMYLLQLGGRLHLAKLSNPQRILDVGTGTGIWAIEMAEDHPQAVVIGTDISPIQPPMVPPNCKFEVDDMEEPWTFKDPFDFIHMRAMGGCFTNLDGVLQQVYDHLEPGGIFEYQDYGSDCFFNDGRPTKGHNTPLARWTQLLLGASEKIGRPFGVAQLLKEKMTRIGFEDIQEKVAVWPVGEWPKDKNLKVIGKWSRAGLLDSVEVYGLNLLTQVLGWSLKDVTELHREVIHDLRKSSENKYYFHAWFVHGRKPLSAKRGVSS